MASIPAPRRVRTSIAQPNISPINLDAKTTQDHKHPPHVTYSLGYPTQSQRSAHYLQPVQLQKHVTKSLDPICRGTVKSKDTCVESSDSPSTTTPKKHSPSLTSIHLQASTAIGIEKRTPTHRSSLSPPLSGTRKYQTQPKKSSPLRHELLLDMDPLPKDKGKAKAVVSISPYSPSLNKELPAKPISGDVGYSSFAQRSSISPLEKELPATPVLGLSSRFYGAAEVGAVQKGAKQIQVRATKSSMLREEIGKRRSSAHSTSYDAPISSAAEASRSSRIPSPGHVAFQQDGMPSRASARISGRLVSSQNGQRLVTKDDKSHATFTEHDDDRRISRCDSRYRYTISESPDAKDVIMGPSKDLSAGVSSSKLGSASNFKESSADLASPLPIARLQGNRSLHSQISVSRRAKRQQNFQDQSAQLEVRRRSRESAIRQSSLRTPGPRVSSLRNTIEHVAQPSNRDRRVGPNAGEFAGPMIPIAKTENAWPSHLNTEQSVPISDSRQTMDAKTITSEVVTSGSALQSTRAPLKRLTMFSRPTASSSARARPSKGFVTNNLRSLRQKVRNLMPKHRHVASTVQHPSPEPASLTRFSFTNDPELLDQRHLHRSISSSTVGNDGPLNTSQEMATGNRTSKSGTSEQNTVPAATGSSLSFSSGHVPADDGTIVDPTSTSPSNSLAQAIGADEHYSSGDGGSSPEQSSGAEVPGATQGMEDSSTSSSEAADDSSGDGDDSDAGNGGRQGQGGQPAEDVLDGLLAVVLARYRTITATSARIQSRRPDLARQILEIAASVAARLEQVRQARIGALTLARVVDNLAMDLERSSAQAVAAARAIRP
ncbi:MAG: hypothetical protein M1818_001996 [Claussenomyces sp. TS43310]|nr:MAG: hypothetical protein M1818_001996 [Claussenomyces sp. TS43310]